MEVIVQDANNIVIEVDQGRQGRGISTVGLVTVGADYYLLFTFTDGSTEQVGPIAPIVTEVLFAEARNAEATTILKGQPVYLFQAQGNLATVKLAFNTSDATSAKTLGLAAENIAPGAQGLITCQGTLGGLNTSAYSEGDTLYLGATAGTLTNVKPQAPNHLVYIGVVERANAGAGQIYVRVQNGYELDEIHDVLINSPVNGNTLIYDASTSLWKNAGITPGTGISVTNGPASITVGNTGVLSFSGGTTGLTPATATTGAVTLAGTLATTNGGTGLTSFNANRIFYSSSTSAIGLSANLTFDGSTLTNTGAVKFGNGAATNTSRLMVNNATNTATGIQLFQDGIESWIMGMPANSAGLAWSASGNEQMRLTTTGLGIGTSSPTNKLSVDGNANITGNVTLGDASTDTVQVNGYMGVGGAASSARGLLVTGSTMTGSTQIGLDSSITGSATGTSLIAAVNGTPTTAAAAFTVTDLIGLRAGDVAKGAGSTITNKHGLYIVDQTQGTNNYGVTSLVSSGTNKWNIYASGTAANYFAGNVLVGTSTAYAWSNNFNPVIRLGAGAYVSGRAPSANYDEIYVGTNAYNDGVWKYGVDGFALQYYQDSGQHVFRNAASGTANAAITFNERFAINQGEAVFNDPGNDYDFRVESDTNTHALFVRGSDGFVGIGTSSPGALLHLNANNAAIRLSEAGTYYGSIQVDSAGGLTIASDPSNVAANSRLIFGVDGTERLRIDSSGNLGIGTSAPTTKLDVAGIDGQGIQFRTASRTVGIGQISSEAAVYWGSGTALTFSTAAVERARIDTSGNLLVGTTTNTNSSRLTVNGTISETVSSVQYLVASQFDVGTAPNKIPLNQYLGNLAYQNASAIAGRVGLSAGTAALPSIGSATDAATGQWFPATSVMAWSTGGVERMRLDAAGNLGLGVTPVAWNVAYRALDMGAGAFMAQPGASDCYVLQNAYFDTGWKYRYSSTLAARYSQINGVHSWSNAPSGTAGNAISFTQAMTLDASGNLALGTTTPFTRFDSASARTTALSSIASFNTMPVSVTDTTAFAQGVGGGINFRAQLSVSNYSTYASIWSFRESATTVDYRGSLLFGTAANGLGYPLERMRITSTGNQVLYQPAESAQNTSVTLTAANLQTRIITSNAAVTLTLPTGANLDTYVGGMAVDSAFECTFIATTANAITIAANGNTTVGSLTVAGNTSGTFRFRKTAANTFTVYRVA